MRSERQIIPEALRTIPRQTGNCDVVREAGDNSTPRLWLLSLPPDHPAGALLSTSWTVPAPQALPSAGSWSNDLGARSSSPLRAPSRDAGSAEASTATSPQAGSKRSSASMDAHSRSWERHAIVSKRGRHDLPANPDLVADRQAFMLRQDVTWRHPLRHICVDNASESPSQDAYPAPCELLFTDFVPWMTSAEDQNVSLTDFPQVAAAENSFARAASISRDFARVTSAEDRTFARLLSGGVDFERLMSDLALRVRA